MASNDRSPSPKTAVDSFLQTAAQLPAKGASARSSKRPHEARGRLLFAMDATASRERTWDHACQLQAQMFEDTAELGGLSVQLCYYRGFNEFESSRWVDDPRQLQREMAAVRCLGGHTQIHKVLNHAIEETRSRPINALVLVADCMEERVDELCHLAGQLGLQGVPVFVFQEGKEPNASRAFAQIARLSNGAHVSFDKDSIRQLRELLSAVAVFASGGADALHRFGRRHGTQAKQLSRQLHR